MYMWSYMIKIWDQKMLYFHGWIFCFPFLSSEAHNKILFRLKLYMYFISYKHKIYYIFLGWKILDFDFFLLWTSFNIKRIKAANKIWLFSELKYNFIRIIYISDFKLIIFVHELTINYIINWYNKYN